MPIYDHFFLSVFFFFKILDFCGCEPSSCLMPNPLALSVGGSAVSAPPVGSRLMFLLPLLFSSVSSGASVLLFRGSSEFYRFVGDTSPSPFFASSAIFDFARVFWGWMEAFEVFLLFEEFLVLFVALIPPFFLEDIAAALIWIQDLGGSSGCPAAAAPSSWSRNSSLYFSSLYSTASLLKRAELSYMLGTAVIDSYFWLSSFFSMILLMSFALSFSSFFFTVILSISSFCSTLSRILSRLELSWLISRMAGDSSIGGGLAGDWSSSTDSPTTELSSLSGVATGGLDWSYAAADAGGLIYL